MVVLGLIVVFRTILSSFLEVEIDRHLAVVTVEARWAGRGAGTAGGEPAPPPAGT